MNNETATVVEPEVVDRAVELRRPNVPTTINELAALDDKKGAMVVQRRSDIVQALRLASIQLTFPHDWTLFRTEENQSYGYLGDQGCDRIKKMWGIQVLNLGPNPQPRPAVRIACENGDFAYRITGDGVCGMTGESVFDMQGIRYSTDPYAKQHADGIQREVAVEKAARANLDGGITRELAGLKAIPIEELTEAWKGTWKKVEQCNKGKGFGTKDERVGGKGPTGVEPAQIPTCVVCAERGKPNVKMLLRPAGNPPFWGCPNYQEHRDQPYTIDDSKVRAGLSKGQKNQRGGSR